MAINDLTEMIPACSMDFFDYDRDPTLKIPRSSKNPREWQGKRDESRVLQGCSRSLHESRGKLWMPMGIFAGAILLWAGIVWYGLAHVNEIMYVLVLWNRG